LSGKIPRGRRAAIGAVLEFVAGAGLLVVLLSDIFRTVLLPRPTRHALRLAPVVAGAVAPAWLRAAGMLASADSRQAFRGSLGPMLLVVTLLVWVGGLFLAFGTMLHAFADRLAPPATFGDGVYYAASAFLTLGVAPATASGAARVIAVAAGLVGLATVTVLVTFILSVQNEITRREVLVLRTEVSTGRPPTGLALLETYARSGMVDQLAGTFRNWEEWAADVLHSHRANPVLAHFRSADEDGEWLAVFGAVLDAAALLLATVEHKQIEGAVSAARLLLAMGSRTVSDLADIFRLQPETEFARPDAIASEVRRGREWLAQCGYAVVPDEEGSIAKAHELFQHYQPQLAALCRELHIPTARHLTENNEPAAKPIIEGTKQS
jgi:hypothetical protein